MFFGEVSGREEHRQHGEPQFSLRPDATYSRQHPLYNPNFGPAFVEPTPIGSTGIEQGRGVKISWLAGTVPAEVRLEWAHAKLDARQLRDGGEIHLILLALCMRDMDLHLARSPFTLECE